MSFDIEDIPDIESAGRLGRRASVDSGVADAYPLHPTTPSDVFASLGVPVALRLVERLQARVFPRSSDIVALASFGGSYTTHSNCGGFDYGATCNEACFGFAPITWTRSTARPVTNRPPTPPIIPPITGTSSGRGVKSSTRTWSRTPAMEETRGSGQSRAHAVTANSRPSIVATMATRSTRTIITGTRRSVRAS